MAKKSIEADKKVLSWLNSSIKKVKFIGLALGGGKTDKTSYAIIEYFPEQKKIFLSSLVDKIKTQDTISADLILYNSLLPHVKDAKYLAVNAALTLPKCIRCKLPCPGYENCNEPEIEWLWKHYKNNLKRTKPRKLFTPYTERCAERLIATELEEAFQPSHALGANMAPLFARAHFLVRRLKVKTIEVHPKLSLWRIGRSLGIRKSHLRFSTHSASGTDSRRAIFESLIEKDIAFIYEQDKRLMVENPNAFEAFMCALTAVLKYQKQCETIPKDFPKKDGWIEIPNEKINWQL